MRSARHPDTWILLSDGSRSRKGTDAPAIRSDELLSEFTCETPARSNAEAAVTANAGNTNLTIAPRPLPNFTLHEQTATPSPAPVRLLASARRELIESLTALTKTLRARATRVPKVPMWIARVRGLRPLPANTALSFAGGTRNGYSDHVVRHCPAAVNHCSVSNPGDGTGTRAFGYETSCIASLYALSAGKRQRTFDVATTRAHLDCCCERPPQ